MVEIFLKNYFKSGKLENWKIGKLEIDFKRKVKNANLYVGGYV
jgi:hypothetical protein